MAGPYALRRDGTVALISNGTATAVPGLTAVKAINDQFALKANGAVWALPAAAQGNWPCWPDCGNAFSIVTVTR